MRKCLGYLRFSCRCKVSPCPFLLGEEMSKARAVSLRADLLWAAAGPAAEAGEGKRSGAANASCHFLLSGNYVWE